MFISLLDKRPDALEKNITKINIFDQDLNRIRDQVFKHLGYDEEKRELYWLSTEKTNAIPVKRLPKQKELIHFMGEYFRYDEVVFLLKYGEWPDSEAHIRQASAYEKDEWARELKRQIDVYNGVLRDDKTERHPITAIMGPSKPIRSRHSRFSGVNDWLRR